MKTKFNPAYSAALLLAALAVAPARADTTNCLDSPAGLVGWWPGEGDATDLATYNDGTLYGGVTFVPGEVNLAFQFDGVTGYILVPNSPNLDLRPAATFAAWINLSQLPSVAGHFMHVMGKSQAGNDLDLQVETDNRVRFYAGPGVSVGSTTVLQTGVWYFVAAIYQATNRMEIYVNGARQGTNAISFTRGANSDPLSIGWNAVFGGRYFNGAIDEVEVYDRALSAGEIQAIYTAGSAGLCHLLQFSIYTAVELGWHTETNCQYQVQWISQLATNDWVNLGDPIQGTGSNIYIFDSTRGQAARFYRVLTLTQ